MRPAAQICYISFKNAVIALTTALECDIIFAYLKDFDEDSMLYRERFSEPSDSVSAA